MTAEKRAPVFFTRLQQQGMALIMLLFIFGLAATAYLVHAFNSNAIKSVRIQQTASSLAAAKEALIGYAVTYRDQHPGELFGFFPCPDTDNNGIAETSCTDTPSINPNVSAIGRLPWRTLGLPPPRDGTTECL